MIQINGYISNILFDQLYNTSYAIVAILALLLAFSIDIKKDVVFYVSNSFLLKLSASLFILVIGLRGYDVGVDTEAYYNQWIENTPPSKSFEMVLYYLMTLLKYLSLPFTLFLLLVAFLFYYFTIKGLNNISLFYCSNEVIIFFSMVSLFFMLSMGINIIRQGLSLALLLYAYSLWLINPQNKKFYIFLFLSIFTHTTSIIPVLIFTIVLIFKGIKLKYFIGLYLIGIVLSFSNIGLLNIAPFVTEFIGESSRRISYLKGESELYSVGFKPQFVIFNSVFCIIAMYIRKSKYMLYNNWIKNYDILLKYFIVSSFTFFMAFQIPYSDRWGLFSWITIPILTAPYFSNIKQNTHFRTSMVLFFISVFLFFFVYVNSK